MRILYIITGLGVGGAEVQLQAITQELLKSRYHILVISLVNLYEVRLSEQIPVIFLNLEKNPITWLRAILKSRQALRTFKPDIIHTHMFHANLFGRLLKIFAWKTPLINSAHSINEGGNVRMILYRLTRIIPNHCTQVSQGALKYFIDKKYFTRKHSSYIHNGVSHRKFFPSDQLRYEVRSSLLGDISNDIFLFISVGRLIEVKNHLFLIEAFSRLPNRKHLRLLVLGNGHLKNQLYNRVIELGLENIVYFIDYSSEVEAYLNAADCFVLPSLYEGFPLSVVESLFCCCPVISSSNGGMVELLPDNYEFLFAPDDLDKLTFLMNRMTEVHFDYKGKLKKELESLTSNFSIESITKQWIDLYKILICKT